MPIPLIGAAISAGVGLWGAHKQSQAASQSLDMQKQFLDKQSALAGQMTDIAKGQFSASQPALNKAMNYYTNLASGGRGAINNAIAPQLAQAQDTYGGAEKGMMARMTPGGGRDQALAELYRQRAGQMALMPMQARSGAMSSLAGLGSEGMNRGMSAMTGASNIMTGQVSGMKNAAELGEKANAPWAEFGKNMGDIFIPYLMGMEGKNKSPLPSRQTVPNMGFMPGGN